MSTSKLSVKDRLANKARSLENKISSVFKPSRSPSPSLIEHNLVGPTPDNSIADASRPVLAKTRVPSDFSPSQIPTELGVVRVPPAMVGDSSPSPKIPSLHVSPPVTDLGPRSEIPPSVSSWS
ncbi:hypothetical protein BYT27DRAFT_7205904 [Phlegmacium glaucopus]|nr:hypothetical protein BYT27DRAFT_7205904 [Phlegmacium glaucopus]